MINRSIQLIVSILLIILIAACSESDYTSIPMGKGNFIIIIHKDGSREVQNTRAKSNFPRGIIEEKYYCGQTDDDYSYILGSRGFTLINMKTEEILQSLVINDFEIQHQETFKTLVNHCNINKEEGGGDFLIINPNSLQLEKR